MTAHFQATTRTDWASLPHQKCAVGVKEDKKLHAKASVTITMRRQAKHQYNALKGSVIVIEGCAVIGLTSGLMWPAEDLLASKAWGQDLLLLGMFA